MKPAKRKIENRRAVSEAIRKTEMAKNALRRLIMGVDDPDTYLKYANALGVLQCLPTIIDNYIADFESIATKDALAQKHDIVRERTAEYLKTFGLKSVEEAKERLQVLESELGKLKEAQRKGLDVVYSPTPQSPNQSN